MIRPARADDLPRLRVLCQRSIRALAVGHYAPPQIEAWADESEAAGWIEPDELPDVWVAQIGVSLVGFAELDPDAAEVRMVFVEPTVADRGIGTRLLRRVEREAAGRGIERLTLRSSLNAVPFFEKFGYQRRSERVIRMRDGTILQIVDMETGLG